MSHLGGWYERNGVGMAVFDPALYNSQAPGTTFRGLTWTDINPDVPTSGVEVQSVFFSPRVGFAYDLSGDGSTLLRGGYGMFNFHDAQGPYSRLHRPALRRDVHQRHQQPAAGATSRTSTRTRSRASAAPSWRRTTSSRGPRAGASRVQRRLPYQMTIEAGYVGSKSDRLLNDGINNLNIVPFGAMLNDPNGDPNHYRPYREYGRTCRCRSTRTTRTTTRCRCCSAGRARSSATRRRTRGRRRSASAAAARGRRRSPRSTSAIRPTASSATTARTC